MQKKEKRKEPGILRILRQYCIAVMLCLCAVLFVCGFFIADSNTRSMISGEEEARLVLAQKEDKLELTVNAVQYEFRPPANRHADSLLRLAPPPVSGLYWAAQSLLELLQP